MMLGHQTRIYMLLLLGLLPATLIRADDDASAETQTIELPKIADEPKFIDPATVMPEKLAAAATVDFSESSLREVFEWLRTEHKIVVLPERSALSAADIVLGDPVSDRLDDAPIYLLLNRLSTLGVGWYYEDEILHITSVQVAEERLATVPYNLGDLLDQDYKSDDLSELIVATIAMDSWDQSGGLGGLSFVGDVMFVRQTDEIHRKVKGLLAALREFGRQTFILDPPKHLQLRQTLEENVGVDFQDTPLVDAVRQLGEDLKVDIRLDLLALRIARIRERQPVTLRLNDRKLKTILQAMIREFELTWILRDGVLWITSNDEAEAFPKTAVYDVRDLCRDGSESDALGEAVMSQTPEVWDEMGGLASVQFAKPGVMVINGQENLLMDVLSLLETYRTALRTSKPRDRKPDENVVTVYYRLHANVADDLTTLLPKLVQPETWKSDASPDAIGEIILADSPPESRDSEDSPSVVVSRAVLIIRQTRASHEDIVQVIRRIETGDPRYPKNHGMGGMGGGGFGGGFFNVTDDRIAKPHVRK